MSDVPRRFVVVVVGLGNVNEHYFCCLQQRAHRGMYLLNLYTVVLLVYILYCYTARRLGKG